ncbi:hypothetical protein V8C40DRAFT_204347 [Trichoderma camerunense]
MATSPMSEASGCARVGGKGFCLAAVRPMLGSGCASMKMGISAADIYGVLMAALTRGISQIFTSTHYIFVLSYCLTFNSYYTRLDIYLTDLSICLFVSIHTTIHLQTNTHYPTAACRCIARSRQRGVQISVQDNTQNSRPTSKRNDTTNKELQNPDKGPLKRPCGELSDWRHSSPPKVKPQPSQPSSLFPDSRQKSCCAASGSFG